MAKSIVQKFKDFLDASPAESNKPMTRGEIATTRAKKKRKTATANRATKTANKKAKKAAPKKGVKKTKKKAER
jgi:hypothetical protein